MAYKINKQSETAKTGAIGNSIKSVAWLVLATQQAFAGYVLLSNFDNYFVIVTSVASLLIAGAIVVMHFVRAHKN